MSESKMSKDKKKQELLIERKKAEDFAVSMRGQMLIGKALHYGMMKMLEVEKQQPYFKDWEKEIEKLKSQNPLQIDKIKKKSEYLENYRTSDIEDLEYISKYLFAPWIEMAKAVDSLDLNTLLKK